MFKVFSTGKPCYTVKIFRFLLRSYEKKASRVEKNEEKRIFFVKTFGSKTEKF